MLNQKRLKEQVTEMWAGNTPPDVNFISSIIDEMDKGNISVINRPDNSVNEWVKQAVLLYFRNMPSKVIDHWFDKVPLKTDGWKEDDFSRAGFRCVPGSIVRRGAYIANKVVLMPCFVNIGAWIDEGTMIDSNSTVGSCAFIGKNCHISDGVTIAGVLEPIGANPVIIEDNCFIGARSVVAEGVRVEQNSVIAAGVILTASTAIIYRDTGETVYGVIPANSVVVPGSRRVTDKLSTNCALIVKENERKTQEKTKLNQDLRGK